NLLLLIRSRHGAEEIDEAWMGDAAFDKAVAFSPHLAGVNLIFFGCRQLPFEVSFKVLDIKAGLLLDKSIDGEDNFHKIVDGFITLPLVEGFEYTKRLHVIHASVLGFFQPVRFEDVAR